MRDDDSDLRPRLHDDTAGGLDRHLDDVGLAGGGDARVDDVAHQQAVGGADRDGGRDGLCAGGGRGRCPPQTAAVASAAAATAMVPRRRMKAIGMGLLREW